MFVLFEETGKFLAGRILSEADSSLQVELDSGKRVKVKAANALLKFEKPAPAALIAAGQQVSEEIELDLAWEFASDEEFSFSDLARDYFSADASKPASVEQQAAALEETAASMEELSSTVKHTADTAVQVAAQCPRGGLVSAGRAAEAEVDAARVQLGQGAKRFSHDQRRMVGQHDAA